jgi:hypothetical protein
LRADERLHGGYKRAWDEQQIQAENAHEVEQSVEAGHDFPGFDRRDMRLRQADLRAEFPLSPTPLGPRILYLSAQIGGQAFESQGLDMPWYIIPHVYIL